MGHWQTIFYFIWVCTKRQSYVDECRNSWLVTQIR